MKNSDSNLVSIDVRFLPNDEKYYELYKSIKDNISEGGWDETSYVDYDDEKILDLLKSFVSHSIEHAIILYQSTPDKSS